MTELVIVNATRCTCEQCGHVWTTLTALPQRSCRNCGSRSWNGTKPVGRPRTAPPSDLGLYPAPTRVRELGEL